LYSDHLYGGSILGGSWFSNTFNKIRSLLTQENLDKAIDYTKKGINLARKADTLISNFVPEYNDTKFKNKFTNLDERFKRIGVGKKKKSSSAPRRR
jgi:hypothetical protein